MFVPDEAKTPYRPGNLLKLLLGMKGINVAHSKVLLQPRNFLPVS